MLRLGKDLVLPPEAVTETFGILAVRGAGKSNAAAVMAEEMFKAKLPFVAVDPVGSWWGLRSSRDGKGPGLPIPIFGGKHGDVPLERGGGQVLADLIVDQRLSCVVDLSAFESESAKKQFLLDFAKRLYQRNEAPLHLFLEEADDYIPQRPMRDEPELLRAWENIVRRGRARGLGMTLITQRSAAINKNVLTQVQTLITLRTTGPQDRDAIAEWVKYHQQSREILESLASLKDGDAWVWSPEFLGKTVRMHFRQRETFDSGATPRASAAASRTPATLADVDLAAISRKMAATIEKAKAEDPKELRRQLAERDRQIRELRAATPTAPAAEVRMVEIPAMPAETLARLEEATGAALDAAGQLREAQTVAARILDDARQLAARAARPMAPPARPIPTVARPSLPRRQAAPAPSSEVRLRAGARRMLEAIARRYPAPTTEAQMAQLAGLARTGGTFSTYLSELRRGGYLTETRQGLELTDAGWEASGITPGSASPQTTDEVLQLYAGVLRAGARRMIESLMAVYPSPMSKPALGAEARVETSGGTFGTYLSDLRKAGLVDDLGDEVKASELLMNPGAA